ncbi:CsgG/HfaB family protein [Larkinella arboricola]
MKTLIYTSAILLIWAGAFIYPQPLLAQDSKNKSKDKKTEVTLEEVAEKCKGLPRDKRVVVKVARFNVSTKSAQAHATFGDELATMLTSAIQQTSCFRVMEMTRNVSDATGEIAFAQDGFTNGSGPQAGAMLGAQLIVTGEVTDFSEGNKSTTVGALNFGGNSATVGFTLKVINPQTGEVLFSKDINMKGSSSGFRGLNLGGSNGLKIGGTTENRAVQDAVQKAIIKSVEILADAKDNMDIPEPMKPKEVKRYTAQNCQTLRNGSPKVMILITEATTSGTSRAMDDADLNRQERLADIEARKQIIGAIATAISSRKNKKTEEPTSRQTASSAVVKPVVIEQSATETELIRHFVESGFRVVDPKVYGKMRQIADSSADLSSIAALGLKMGANLIITGQTISERTNSQGGMVSCRARLEIRAIATEDGSILATNAVAGGGIDVSEAIANKIAIHNASENMAQYLMERLCSMNLQFSGISAGPTKSTSKQLAAPSAAASLNTTEMAVSNATYAKLQAIATAIAKNPKVKGVQKTIKGTEGTLLISHLDTTDELVETLSRNPAVKFEVTGLEEGRASLAMN